MRRMPGTTPTVLRVMRSGAQGKAARVAQDVHGPHDRVVVVEGLAHAHEDDVAQRGGSRAARRARATWTHLRDDLAGVRWRRYPIWPVAQKTQPMAQPAWLLTQAVTRPVNRMRTVSIRCAVGEAKEVFPGEAVA